MNSSEDSMQFVKAEIFGGVNRVTGRDSNSNTASDPIDWPWPARPTRTAWESGLYARTTARPTFAGKAFPGDRKFPPLPQAAVCSNHDRQAILFVDGEDAPTRRKALEKCMRRFGPARGRKLFIRCKQGEVDLQLGYARGWAEDIRVRCPSQKVVIGIDGIDQWLRSPRDVASQLQSIVDVGAAVACAVDSRYVDCHFLTFYLRILGIEVIREPLIPKRLINVSSGPERLRSLSEAASGAPSRHFPTVRTPRQGACTIELQEASALTRRDNAASQRESKYRKDSEHAIFSKFSEAGRIERAKAYRNSLAVNRLVREKFGL